jgi:hypothetical protein
MCLLQLLRVSVLYKSELNMDKTNDAYITIEIITYKLLCHLSNGDKTNDAYIPMHRHPNVDEMGINTHTGLLQYRIQHYKQIYT